jgi:zinc protease
MFEHMMFKATKHMPNEKMDRLTEDVGGFNNASTWPDFTNYYEVVPSNHIEPLLWAEADRMVSLNVDEGNFASERDVVKEEYRQSVLGAALRQALLAARRHYVPKAPVSPRRYRETWTSWVLHLVPMQRSFIQTYYRPDNAVLIVSGDFDQKQLDGLD